DQLGLAGIDLRDTLSGPAAKKLLERERTLRSRLGSVRAELATAAQANSANVKTLGADLQKLQTDYAGVWTEIRNSSPVYREQLTQNQKAGSLGVLEDYLKSSKSVMLFYYLGAKESHLVILG